MKSTGPARKTVEAVENPKRKLSLKVASLDVKAAPMCKGEDFTRSPDAYCTGGGHAKVSAVAYF